LCMLDAVIPYTMECWSAHISLIMTVHSCRT